MTNKEFKKQIDYEIKLINDEVVVEPDPDASAIVWEELYKKIYTADKFKFWGELDYENLESKYNNNIYRIYAKLKKLEKSDNSRLQNQLCPKGSYEEFKMSGDTIFNFKKKGKQPKYNDYLNVLKKDKEKYYSAVKKLNYCASMHHNMCNFSFMPMTGRMQIYKGNQNDRFDRFLCNLKDYYTKLSDWNEHSLIKNAKINGPALHSFLQLFNEGNEGNKDNIHKAVYKYCKEIYLIDDKDLVDDKDDKQPKKLVDALIESGSKELDTLELVTNYMDLAIRYWDIKKKKLVEDYGIDEKDLYLTESL